MTVASLWKALDRAGCGRPVGSKEIQDHHQLKAKTNQWNFNEMNSTHKDPGSGPVLAVDLSIWICEALTSTAMQQNHVVDPALQLVYSRALKLLNLGIKLVVVIEGKRRIRRRNDDQEVTADGADLRQTSVQHHKFRKRRSGARFWTACQQCEELLQLLGIPVVRAKAEGEALCALLNQEGIVDGVISNDGDCFLFGAKVLYTKFSIENLDQSQVMRYDASDIRALVDDDDADEYDDTRQTSKEGQEVVKLSRSDLIAFAILTGSDLAGDGLSKVGCRKAIRFIRKCRIDNPLKLGSDFCTSPALNQLIEWEKAGAATAASAIVTTTSMAKNASSGPHCSCCGHAGTKTSHAKNGCQTCGTEPGEPCFRLSPGGRFRKTLRDKAIEMGTRFDPSYTLGAYNHPNDNQLPLALVGKSARTLQMGPPRLHDLLQSSFIVRGRSIFESQEFIRKTVSTYLARTELCHRMANAQKQPDGISKVPKNRNLPVPLRINKLVLRAGKKTTCEVRWLLKGTTTDAEGNPIDEVEFSTLEEDHVMRKCYPQIYESFEAEEVQRKQQGTTEQQKRRAFLLDMFDARDDASAEKRVGETAGQETNAEIAAEKKKKKKKLRDEFFDKDDAMYQKVVKKSKGESDDVNALLVHTSNLLNRGTRKRSGNRDGHPTAPQAKDKNFHEISSLVGCGDDIAKILFAGDMGTIKSIGNDSTIDTASLTDDRIEIHAHGELDDYGNAMSPGHIHFLSNPGYESRENKNSHVGKWVVCNNDGQSIFPVVSRKMPSRENGKRVQCSCRRSKEDAALLDQVGSCFMTARHRFSERKPRDDIGKRKPADFREKASTSEPLYDEKLVRMSESQPHNTEYLTKSEKKELCQDNIPLWFPHSHMHPIGDGRDKCFESPKFGNPKSNWEHSNNGHLPSRVSRNASRIPGRLRHPLSDIDTDDMYCLVEERYNGHSVDNNWFESQRLEDDVEIHQEDFFLNPPMDFPEKIGRNDEARGMNARTENHQCEENYPCFDLGNITDGVRCFEQDAYLDDRSLRHATSTGDSRRVTKSPPSHLAYHECEIGDENSLPTIDNTDARNRCRSKDFLEPDAVSKPNGSVRQYFDFGLGLKGDDRNDPDCSSTSDRNIKGYTYDHFPSDRSDQLVHEGAANHYPSCAVDDLYAHNDCSHEKRHSKRHRREPINRAQPEQLTSRWAEHGRKIEIQKRVAMEVEAERLQARLGAENERFLAAGEGQFDDII